MQKVEIIKKRITDPSEIIAIGEFKELMNRVNKTRLCSIHNFPVEYQWEDSTDNPFSPPSIMLNGCCEEAIVNELEFIKTKLKETQQLKNLN